MKLINFYLLLLLALFFQSCAKELIDEASFKLSDGGKTLEIHIDKGETLKTRLKSISPWGIETMIISGDIGGHTLSFLRELSGGNDSEFLGGRNLGVLNISNAAFYSSDEVYYVREEENLKIGGLHGIPPYAFENCYALNTVKLPNPTIAGYFKIEQGAFKDCLLLRYIDWGKCRKIGKEAFMNCSTLALGEPLILPEGLEEIGDYAFKKTIPLDVDLPSTVKLIGKEAFSPILGNVIIRSVDPPTITNNSFVFDEKSDKILFVPIESVSKYNIEPYISIFSEIKGLDN